ncbi:MAG: hypothetical protein DRH11_13395 [Deltaproteobacteria bacterium]|mgnify:CR=1 FL=1|nr:MAG: hypothetical protein DRH11_13395 [Deltaproteobacteria bacterium]
MHKIWIDLDNSPHVPFFKPIISELEKRGFQVVLTARDCFQTCGLADLFGLNYKRIGRHYGGNKALKVLGTLIRAAKLTPTALRRWPALSVSHGSRSQLIVSWFLSIPFIMMFDYEYTKKLGFVAPTWHMAPEMVPDSAIPYDSDHFLKYPGLKEDVYAQAFHPDPNVIEGLGLRREDFIVTIRPPATEAHYHNPESEILFDEVVNVLGKYPDVRMVILPRNEVKQTEYIKSHWQEWCENGKIIIPDHVVNGLDLIWFSDFVVSGGGTMNREAAALEVPVYSIFRGKIGAVDRYLSQEGRLTLLQSVEDVHNKMRIERRKKGTSVPQKNRAALNTIVNHIIEVLEKETGKR